MAKKKTGTADASESKPKTPRKVGKKSAKPVETGLVAGVDTQAAAKLAALMIAKKVELPASGGGGSGKSSTTIQQLKQAGGLPASLGGGLNAIAGPKKNLGHAHNQLGRNQVGGHINPNVPRRTPG